MFAVGGNFFQVGPSSHGFGKGTGGEHKGNFLSIFPRFVCFEYGFFKFCLLGLVLTSEGIEQDAIVGYFPGNGGDGGSEVVDNFLSLLNDLIERRKVGERGCFFFLGRAQNFLLFGDFSLHFFALGF